MSKKGSSPQPDYAGMLQAMAASQQAAKQAEISQQQLDWAKQQAAEDRATNQPIIDAFTKSMNNATDFAKQQQDFYTSTYQPMEADFANTAKNWNSQDRKDQVVGQATANVAQQYEGARQNAEQQLRDYGVDPSAPRYAGTDIIARTSQGAAAAGMATTATNNLDQQALGLQQTAINVGRGYPGAIATTSGTANAAGNSAIGGTLQTTASGANTMGTGAQWAGQSNGMMGTTMGSLNTMNSNYNNAQAAGAQANNISSGIGSMLGLIGGASIGKFADGGAVPAQASPTQGQAVDDVPAQLTAGEYVIPKDVVQWIGEKGANDLIAKARKERQTMQQHTGAVPGIGPASGQPPTFVSRSQPAAALPLR